MGKAQELKTTTKIVKAVLEQNVSARNSDDVLYIAVCERINKDTIHMPLKFVLGSRKAFGLPAFESVRRTRQKIQAMHPELSGTCDVEAHRIMNEETFREYARGV